MLVRTLSNVVVLHVPGQGVWFTTMERGTYHVSDDPREVYERLAPLATSRLVIDNELDPRPRARALGRRRGHRRHRRGRASGCDELDLLPVAVPGRGVPRRARPPPRHAPLPGRRALVREPLGAQGRDALLDERERRRQVEARGRRPRHPDGQGLRRRTRRHRAQRPAGHRAAARVRRRDRALDDLPGASRRRRDPPRPRVDGGHRRDGHQLPVRHAGARRVASPSSSTASPTPPMP